MVYGTVVTSAAVLAMLVYRYDMYEKEPWYLLLLALVLGMGTGWGAGSIEDVLLATFDWYDNVAANAAVAAVVEELAKLLCVLLVALLFRGEFNDPIDGLIYGAFAGLGAAVIESLFYVSLEGDAIGLGGQEIVRLLLHLTLGGLAGFGLGLARFRMPLWPIALLTSLTAAIALHFLWDYWIGLADQDVTPASFLQFTSVGLMGVALALFGTAVLLGSRWSRDVIAPRSRKRLWGWPFSLWFRGRD
ncbi:MAG: hypothetical protein CMJ48_06650 [Planctomycetaceae bacterium]|nr:hypothetical protein [Planctomycetaceae bacterium]